MPEPLPDYALLRRGDVRRVTGMSDTSIYEAIKSRGFPRPVQLGAQIVAWREAEVREWVRALPPAEMKRRRGRPRKPPAEAPDGS